MVHNKKIKYKYHERNGHFEILDFQRHLLYAVFGIIDRNAKSSIRGTGFGPADHVRALRGISGTTNPDSK